MGGAVQRLEALLVALVLAITVAAVAATVIVRQTPPTITRSAPPGPVAGAAQDEPATPARDSVHIGEALRFVVRFSRFWPWLLLASLLAGGGLLVARSRQRRMPYQGQGMGQFLAAADQTTRATTVRVLRDLAARGLLAGELAQLARIGRVWPSISLRLHRPQLTLPKFSTSALRLPTLQRPRLSLPKLERPRLRRAALTLPRLRWPRPTRDPSALVVPIAAEQVAASTRWTAEDRALAVAAALMEIWGAEAACPILAIDTASTPGYAPVLLTLDPHASDAQIADLPARLAELRPHWRVRWRRERLEVVVRAGAGQLPSGGPALLSILTHGPRSTTTRFLPLASCQHLGIYGAGASQALHALLGSLLFAQSPASLALAIIDQGEISPLYRQVAHLLAAPTTDDAIDILALALRQQKSGGDQRIRPLLLVVVEPDEARLRALSALLTRLRAMPGAPLHFILVQEQLRSAGRELYALLPALITHGQGRADLLPGGAWPKRGAARLVGRGLRLEGCALSVDDTALAGTLAQLRGSHAGLPPCLLDFPAPGEPAQGNQDGAMTDTPIPSEPSSRLGALLRAARAAGCADVPPRALPLPEIATLVPPPTTAALAPEPENGWPAGPAPLGRIALAELLARVVSAPAIGAGPANEQGITKNRLAEQIQLPAAQAKALAETLLAWFDLAGLLAEPTQPERLRHPRALRTTDLAEIAALLHATPCPDQATVQALWTSTNEGNN